MIKMVKDYLTKKDQHEWTHLHSVKDYGNRFYSVNMKLELFKPVRKTKNFIERAYKKLFKKKQHDGEVYCFLSNTDLNKTSIVQGQVVEALVGISTGTIEEKFGLYIKGNIDWIPAFIEKGEYIVVFNNQGTYLTNQEAMNIMWGPGSNKVKNTSINLDGYTVINGHKWNEKVKHIFIQEFPETENEIRQTVFRYYRCGEDNYTPYKWTDAIPY